jgi:AraC-like DNA-binding protein
MKQYPLKSSETPFFAGHENGGEKFFNLPQRFRPVKSTSEGLAKFQWLTIYRKTGVSLVVVLQGLNKTQLDDFLNYISTRCNPVPSASSLEDILSEVSCLTEEESSNEFHASNDYPPIGEEEAEILFSTPPGSNADTLQPTTPTTHCSRGWMLYDIDRIIEANLDNDSFRVTDLAKGLNYCVMQVHRIIKELTDLPSAHYIRRYRLLKSQSLLADGKYNVSQVAYTVGFKSPEHFARCFRNEFGLCPSDFRGRAAVSIR